MLTTLQTEVWTEYVVGAVVFLLRFFARWKVVGFKGLQWDDLFAFLALIFWTLDAATVQVISTHGSLVGLTAEKASTLSDEEAAMLEIGSKALFIAWLSYISLIWCMKASLLFFYRRLTLGLWQAKAVKIMGIICVITYIATVLAVLCHCTPVQMNWQIKPFAGQRCVSMAVNVLTIAALNITTDLCILAIPIPLLWKVRIPIGKKIVIGLLLCSGLFVITAAIIRAVLTMGNAEEVDNADIWGIRETFVSVIAVSAPAIRPLFSPGRWVSKSSDASKGLAYDTASKPAGTELATNSEWNDNSKKGFNTTQAVRLPDDNSDEYIMHLKESRESDSGSNSDRDVSGPLKIEVTQHYETGEASEMGDDDGWRHGASQTNIIGGRFDSPV